ncbi:uncharacterized protein LOC129732406 [Wyeomyia smithii]|uniref:uncharacterized protein LOC129732406 n=1 Tax=Wyeomyia smithii TaxID=174621 RepID=UPI0024681D65|nr:uncharacterized protein LOC129732406 [Wyeomyia smithii]
MNGSFSENGSPSLDITKELELVIDVFDNGQIRVASVEDCSEERQSSSFSDLNYSQNAPVEQLFRSEEPNRWNNSEENFLHVNSYDSSDSESNTKTELVEWCPYKCEKCTKSSHPLRDNPDDVIMLEANILLKVPVRRKHFDRLLEIAQCCHEGLK